eukprot:gene627-10322_t
MRPDMFHTCVPSSPVFRFVSYETGHVSYLCPHHLLCSGYQKAIIESAIRHWETNTCISFVPRQSEKEYTVFQSDGGCGCCSYVGRMGDGEGQGVNLAGNCIRNGTIAHEIGHLIGFWHEHTRPDRDSYVEIVKDNVLTGELKNFRKLTFDEVNSFKVPYDFNSIMHYSKTTFSRTGYDITIRPLKGLYTKPIGQRVRLSEKDIKQANLLYNCPTCGRTMVESSGNFSFLTTNMRNLQPLTCLWRVLWTTGEKLTLRIKSIDFKHNCRKVYMEIRNGTNEKSPLYGRYCRGKKPPETITLANSGLWLKFHYGYKYFTTSRIGFTAEYTVTCSGVIQAEKGELMSPGYPDNYQPNKKCDWLIVVPKSGKVAVRFQMLDLEKSDDCEYDHIELSDGITGKRLEKLCGKKAPKNYIVSTGNKMKVKFNTDSDVHHRGFALTFVTEIDECASGAHNCSEICINRIDGYECRCPGGQELHSNGRDCERACGKVYKQNEVEGTIQSPSYPENYPINRHCKWEIRAKDGYKISLTMIAFDLEESKVCNPSYDYVGIDTGSSSEKFCGAMETPRTFESQSNRMKIEFNSDNTVSGKGFKATFMHIRDHCAKNNGNCDHICANALEKPICSCNYGYVLDTDKRRCIAGACSTKINSTTGIGSVSSPNYPRSYQSEEKCKWDVMTLPGQRFNISFDDIICNERLSSKLMVKWLVGKKTHQESICEHSGRKNVNFQTEGNMFSVEFKLGKNDMGGFKLSYTSFCGGTFRATRKVQSFFSHIKYGSQNYPPQQDCIWRISARGRRRKVELRLKKFQLEDSPCNFDFVKIYDGKDLDEQNLLGTECGHKLHKSEYRSSGRVLTVHFKSDTSVSGSGFEAEYVKPRRLTKRHHIRLYDPFKDAMYLSRSRDLYF